MSYLRLLFPPEKVLSDHTFPKAVSMNAGQKGSENVLFASLRIMIHIVLPKKWEGTRDEC